MDLAGNVKGKGDAGISIGSGVHNVDVKNFEIREVGSEHRGMSSTGVQVTDNIVKNSNLV